MIEQCKCNVCIQRKQDAAIEKEKKIKGDGKAQYCIIEDYFKIKQNDSIVDSDAAVLKQALHMIIELKTKLDCLHPLLKKYTKCIIETLIIK
jgi:hypothetical protein